MPRRGAPRGRPRSGLQIQMQASPSCVGKTPASARSATISSMPGQGSAGEVRVLHGARRAAVLDDLGARPTRATREPSPSAPTTYRAATSTGAPARSCPYTPTARPASSKRTPVDRDPEPQLGTGRGRGLGQERVENVATRRDQQIDAGTVSFTARVTDPPAALNVTCADAPARRCARTASSSPQRCSCTTPGRAIWWVDSVSLGKTSRSTSTTSCPCRASRSAVAAPAARAPTTTTSWRCETTACQVCTAAATPTESVAGTDIGRGGYRDRGVDRLLPRRRCDNPGVSGGAILERERELEALGAAAREAGAGDGSVVLIVGEAGIGKSSLVDAVGSVLPAGTRLLIGYCDDLATPRVLGPLRDLTGSVGSALTRALEAGDRSRVSDALRAELDRPEQPTVLVVEDVHWADEATLDVLRFLVRRIASLPAVLVLTYRDVELARDHPLQQLLGLAARYAAAAALTPARLSADAVRQLGAHTGMDSEQVFAVTSGNPFFVAEILASGDAGGVPHTVAEAVRARLGDLDRADTRRRRATCGDPVRGGAMARGGGRTGGLASLTLAERRGVLTVSPTRVTFAHELARRAVVDSMPSARRVALQPGRPVGTARSP